MSYRLISFAGLLAMIGLAWFMSENRRRVDWRLVISALALQFALALLILRTEFGEHFFVVVRQAFIVVTEASDEGARFLFGNLTKTFTLSEEAVLDVEGPLFINGVVAFSDLLVVVGAWGSCVAGEACPADLDHSGTVNFDDLLFLLTAWGPCS